MTSSLIAQVHRCSITGRAKLRSPLRGDARTMFGHSDASTFPLLKPSSPAGVPGPAATFNENLAIGGHTGFGSTVWLRDQQFNAHDLLDALIAKVSVFRSKRTFRIDTRNSCVDWSLRAGVKVDARGLAQLYSPDISFWHETAQI